MSSFGGSLRLALKQSLAETKTGSSDDKDSSSRKIGKNGKIGRKRKLRLKEKEQKYELSKKKLHAAAAASRKAQQEHLGIQSNTDFKQNYSRISGFRGKSSKKNAWSTRSLTSSSSLSSSSSSSNSESDHESSSSNDSQSVSSSSSSAERNMFDSSSSDDMDSDDNSKDSDNDSDIGISERTRNDPPSACPKHLLITPHYNVKKRKIESDNEQVSFSSSSRNEKRIKSEKREYTRKYRTTVGSASDRSMASKKSSSSRRAKSRTVTAPTPDVINWIESMPVSKMRKHICSGQRVKVCFVSGRSKSERRKHEALTRRIKWYGGCVSEVYADGKRVRIHYDDGTSEVSDFPDDDIVIDDMENGVHKVSAKAFKCPSKIENLKAVSVSSSPRLDDEMDGEKSDSPLYDNFEHKFKKHHSEKAKSRLLEETRKEKRRRERNIEMNEKVHDSQTQCDTHISDPSTKASTVTDSSFSLSSNNNSANEYSESSCSITSNDMNSTPSFPKKEALHSSIHDPIDQPIEKRIVEKNDVNKTEKTNRTIRKIKISNSFNRIEKNPSPDDGRRYNSQVSSSSNEDEFFKPRLKHPGKALRTSKPLTIKLGKRDKSTSPKLIESERNFEAGHYLSAKEKNDNPQEKTIETMTSVNKRIFRSRHENESKETPKLGDTNIKSECISNSSDTADPIELSEHFSRNSNHKSKTVLDCQDNGYNENLSNSNFPPKDSVVEKPNSFPYELYPAPKDKERSDPLIPPHGIKIKQNSEKLSNANRKIDTLRTNEPVISVKTSTSKKITSSTVNTNMPDKSLTKELCSRSVSPVSLIGVTKKPLCSSYNDSICVVLPNASDSDWGGKDWSKPTEKKDDSSREPYEFASEFSNPSFDDTVTDKSTTIPTSRSGRLAAQKANQRIVSKQDIMDEEFAVSRKRREKLPFKKFSSSTEFDKSPGERSQHFETSFDKSEREPWVQCDRCQKWRLLPRNVPMESLPERWYCELNKYDPKRNNCNAPEQTAKDIAMQRKKAKLSARNSRKIAAEFDGKKKRSVSPMPGRSPRRSSSEQSDLDNMVFSRKKNHGKNDDFDESLLNSGVKHNYHVKKRNLIGSKGSTDISNQNILNDRSKEDYQTSKPRNMFRGRGNRKESGRSGRGKQPNKEKPENQEWVQCEKCEKWRKLPPRICSKDLPDKWYCNMNTWDPSTASCDVEEEKPEVKVRAQPVSQPSGRQKSSSELSYKNLIFGTGKRQLRTSSERARAAESLFSFATQSSKAPRETSGSNYPTLAYANSFAYVKKQGNNSLRNNTKSEKKVSFLDILDTSRVWNELYGINENPSDVSNGLQYHNSNLSVIEPSYNQVNSQLLKDFICLLLNEHRMNAQEIFLQLQCRELGIDERKKFGHLQAICTIEDSCATLKELVKDGLVEESKVKCFIDGEESYMVQYSRVERRYSTNSRNMKMSKPWKRGLK